MNYQLNDRVRRTFPGDPRPDYGWSITALDGRENAHTQDLWCARTPLLAVLWGLPP